MTTAMTTMATMGIPTMITVATTIPMTPTTMMTTLVPVEMIITAVAEVGTTTGATTMAAAETIHWPAGPERILSTGARGRTPSLIAI